MENIHTITITEEAIINAKGKKNSRHTIPVIGYSLKGNEILRESSIEDAAHIIGAHPNYLSQCIIGKRKCKGWIVFPAKDMESRVDEMIEVFCNKAKKNANDAEDAAKWREQENAKEMARKAEEKRLADIARAEEAHRKAIEKAQAKVERLQLEVERKYNLWQESMNKLENAAMELKKLESNENENTTEMEAVA